MVAKLIAKVSTRINKRIAQRVLDAPIRRTRKRMVQVYKHIVSRERDLAFANKHLPTCATTAIVPPTHVGGCGSCSNEPSHAPSVEACLAHNCCMCCNCPLTVVQWKGLQHMYAFISYEEFAALSSEERFRRYVNSNVLTVMDGMAGLEYST